jgi:hypothetical protein
VKFWQEIMDRMLEEEDDGEGGGAGGDWVPMEEFVNDPARPKYAWEAVFDAFEGKLDVSAQVCVT